MLWSATLFGCAFSAALATEAALAGSVAVSARALVMAFSAVAPCLASAARSAGFAPICWASSPRRSFISAWSWTWIWAVAVRAPEVASNRCVSTLKLAVGVTVPKMR